MKIEVNAEILACLLENEAIGQNNFLSLAALQAWRLQEPSGATVEMLRLLGEELGYRL